jgi:hypothetical protein
VENLLECQIYIIQVSNGLKTHSDNQRQDQFRTEQWCSYKINEFLSSQVSQSSIYEAYF